MPKKKAKKEKQSSVTALTSTKAASSSSPAVSSSSLEKILLSTLQLPKQQHPKYNIEEILSGFVWVVHDFFLEKECRAWIDFVEGRESNNNNNVNNNNNNNNKSKLDYVKHPATKYVTNRECYRWQENNIEIATIIYERMKYCGILREIQQKVFNTGTGTSSKLTTTTSSSSSVEQTSDYSACGCNPNIRLYKYEKNMRFGKHVDESNIVDGIGQTEVTVLIYLSDCIGGATRFYPPYYTTSSGSNSNSNSKKKKGNSNDNSNNNITGSIAFQPKRGALLVHVHGDRCLEHEADPVINGMKYILRTDIVYTNTTARS